MGASPQRVWKCYLPGGQCGLSLPVAPRHCLSPGPGAPALATGAARASALTAAMMAIHRLDLIAHLPSGVEAHSKVGPPRYPVISRGNVPSMPIHPLDQVRRQGFRP